MAKLARKADETLKQDRKWDVKNTFVNCSGGGKMDALRRVRSDSAVSVLAGMADSDSEADSDITHQGGAEALGCYQFIAASPCPGDEEPPAPAPKRVQLASHLATVVQVEAADVDSQQDDGASGAPMRECLAVGPARGASQPCGPPPAGFVPPSADIQRALAANPELLHSLASMIAKLSEENAELRQRLMDPGASSVAQLLEAGRWASNPSPAARPKHPLLPKHTKGTLCTTKTRTSLMLRNLPNNYTREMLLNLVNSLGFEGQFDFLYMPLDRSSGINRGYAFINMVSGSAAERLWHKFDGFCDWVLPTRKVSGVSWCERQGLEAHVQHFLRNSRGGEPLPEDCRPLCLQNGCLAPILLKHP